MAFINTLTACEYKLKCLQIANNTGLDGENCINYAKDMFKWVVDDHVKHEIPVKVTFESKPPIAVALPKVRPSLTLGQLRSDAQQSSLEQSYGQGFL